MSERKSRRKPRRRRRPTFLQRLGKKRKANPVWMHEYERELILRDIRKVGGRVSADTLDREYPDRYNRRWLTDALERMAQQGDLERNGTSSWQWTRRGAKAARAYKLNPAREDARRLGYAA